MKAKLLSLLSNHKGRAITWASSAAVALAAGQIAKLGLDISMDTQAWLTATIAATLGALVDGWTNASTGAGVESIQRQLQGVNPEVKVDAWAGDVTVSAVAMLIQRKEELERQVEELERQKNTLANDLGLLTI